MARNKLEEVINKQVEIGKDLDILISISSLKKFLDDSYDDLYKSLNNIVLEEFVDDSMCKKLRADNFTGTSELATASCEIRIRASNSKLKQEEIDLLEQHKITLKEVVVSEGTPARNYINPVILQDNVLFNLILEKIYDIPEIKKLSESGIPAVISEPEKLAIKSKVVSDETINKIVNLEDKNLVIQLMKLVSSIAIKPKLKENYNKESLSNNILGAVHNSIKRMFGNKG